MPGDSWLDRPSAQLSTAGCEQLAHSCCVVTGFSGIRTRVFRTRVERAIQSAITPPLLHAMLQVYRARQLYKNISILFLFPVIDGKLLTQHLMHHVTVSLKQSKITLQNNCINNTSITQPTLSFIFD